MYTVSELNPIAAAKLRQLADWLAPCDHSDLQIAHGNCSRCFGSIEYCPCGKVEIQSHESNCPESFMAAGRLVGTISMRFFAMEDRNGEFYANLEERYGIKFVPAPRGGILSLVVANKDLTEEGQQWLGCLAAM